MDEIQENQELEQQTESNEIQEQQVENNDVQEISSEDKASGMGWRSRDKYVQKYGDDKGWKSADEFLYSKVDGQSDIEELKRITQNQVFKNTNLEKQLQRISTAQEAFIQMQVQERLQQVINKQVTAIQNGDTQEFNRLKQEEYKINQTAQPARQPEQQQPAKSWEPEAVQKFATKPWTDPTDPLFPTANSIYERTLAESPYISQVDALTKTEAELRRMYPEKFGFNQQRNTMSGNNNQGVRPVVKKTGYDALPADVKTEYNRMVKMGYAGSDKELFARTYNEQNKGK